MTQSVLGSYTVYNAAESYHSRLLLGVEDTVYVTLLFSLFSYFRL